MAWAGEANKRKMVRSSGFEPPRYCYRQPLKLVRLPVPPLPRGVRTNDQRLTTNNATTSPAPEACSSARCSPERFQSVPVSALVQASRAPPEHWRA